MHSALPWSVGPCTVAMLEDWPIPGDACVVGVGVGTGL